MIKAIQERDIFESQHLTGYDKILTSDNYDRYERYLDAAKALFYDGAVSSYKPRNKKSESLPKTVLSSPKNTPPKKLKEPGSPSFDWSKVTSRYLEPKTAQSLLSMTFQDLRWDPRYVM